MGPTEGAREGEGRTIPVLSGLKKDRAQDIRLKKVSLNRHREGET